jgi:hypothetical protein
MATLMFEENDSNNLKGRSIDHDIREYFQSYAPEGRTISVYGKTRGIGLYRENAHAEFSLETLNQMSATPRLIVGDGFVKISLEARVVN